MSTVQSAGQGSEYKRQQTAQWLIMTRKSRLQMGGFFIFYFFQMCVRLVSHLLRKQPIMWSMQQWYNQTTTCMRNLKFTWAPPDICLLRWRLFSDDDRLDDKDSVDIHDNPPVPDNVVKEQDNTVRHPISKNLACDDHIVVYKSDTWKTSPFHALNWTTTKDPCMHKQDL